MIWQSMHGGQSMGCDRQGHWPLPGMPAVVMVIRWHHHRTTKASGCGPQGSRCLPPTTPDRGGSRGVRISGVPQAVLIGQIRPIIRSYCLLCGGLDISVLKNQTSCVQQPLDRVLLGYYRNNLLLVLPKNASKLCVKVTVIVS